MKIKTIYKQLVHAEEFDRLVNEAIEQGWSLIKREMLPGGPLTPDDYRPCMLYAELVMDEPTPKQQEISLMDAMRIIRKKCDSYDHCADCVLVDICCTNLPYKWELPEEAAP